MASAGQVLLDPSHVSSRQALEGCGHCLEPLLNTAPDCRLLPPLLSALLRLADHGYWLVKVRTLLEAGEALPAGYPAGCPAGWSREAQHP